MQDIYLHNSLSKNKEKFTPIDAKNIRMYVCGPTVYDLPHIGNGRAIVVYDILYRMLCHKFGKEHITYVRNITDVDDKINVAAKERKITIQELTSKVTEKFHKNTKALSCINPHIEPKATEHILEMIEIISKLIKDGHAYEANNHVYFDVSSYKDYGKLASRELDEMLSGVRIVVDPHKKNPADFVLWKPADNEDDESSVFDSPFGKGRPGWHIECSAMSMKYLGGDFDIHGGGADLMFPHHTNEIAQSCCYDKKSKFAHYWVHNGFLTVNGEKMSKSLGNFITINDLLEKGINGEVIRYVLLSSHYSKPLDYNEKSLQDAKKSLDSFYRAILRMTKYVETALEDEFIDGLFDDINTPAAFAYLHELARKVNKMEDQAEVNKYASLLKKSANLIGFLEQDPNSWFSSDIPSIIYQKIEERKAAKANRNFPLADKFRAEIHELGFEIEDKPNNEVFIRKL